MTSPPSKRKYPSFSKISRNDAEKVLELTVQGLLAAAEPIGSMIPIETRSDNIGVLKEEVFNEVLKYIDVVGELTDPALKEVVVQDVVGRVIVAILFHMRRYNDLKLKLCRESNRESNETSENMEFVIGADIVTTGLFHYLIIIETKRGHLESGLVQCLLALKYAYEANEAKKPVYGLVTDFTDWRLIIKDKNGFRLSGRHQFFLRTHVTRKDSWLGAPSTLVDIIYNILLSSKDFLNK